MRVGGESTVSRRTQDSRQEEDRSPTARKRKLDHGGRSLAESREVRERLDLRVYIRQYYAYPCSDRKL